MELREHILLADLTAIKLGGAARYVITAKSSADVQEAFNFARERGLRVAPVAGGNAVLAADQGFDGVVILLQGEVVKPGKSLQTLFAGDVLPGIGSVGGAVVDNAVVGSEEIGRQINSLTVLRPDGKREAVLPDVCGFGLHRSIFQTTTNIVLQVTGTISALPQASPLPASSIRLFHDMPDVSAAQVIRELGLAERTMGGISLWGDDPAVALNTGVGTAEQLVQLMSLVKQQARDTLGIQLRDAVHYIGF